jgi:hypothetical protein
MFTIHKYCGMADVPKLLKKFGGGIVIALLLHTQALFAQCGFEENGYLFMHPYFTGTSWKATNYVSNVIHMDSLCARKPVHAAASGLALQGTFVYTVADGSWMMTNGPLENNDFPCSRPTIDFWDPFPLTVPVTPALQPSLPFHLLRRGAADKDTVYLAAVASDGAVYCLHISIRSGKTGAVDTIFLTDRGTSTLGGVWGEPGGSGNDTALWVGGSGGFLRMVPFTANRWGTPRSITIDNTETVTAVGSGYVGTLSGKLFKRSGDSFAAVGLQGASAIRWISGNLAVGDGGTVLVYRGGSWTSHTSGTADYRLGNLTSNDRGAAVELVDTAWKYSVLQLSDSATSISSVSPVAQAGLNQGVFEYSDNGIITLRVYLRDIDNNRVFPKVSLIRGSIVTRLDTADDRTVLLGHNPSAICDTSLAYFNDTVVTLSLNVDALSLETRAQRGRWNASCPFWDWEQFKFVRTQPWGLNDTLMVAAGKDTLRVRNDHQATVSVNPYIRNGLPGDRLQIRYSDGTVRLIPRGDSELRRVMLVDAAGRCVRQYTQPVRSGSPLRLPVNHGGIHFLRIEYRDGSTESRRLLLVGR